MHRRHALVTAATACAAVALSPSCLSPTKITLDIRTDVDCSHVKGTTIAAGAQGDTERRPADVVTSHCAGGAIGTLVVTPERGDGSRVSFKVVMGVDADAQTCTADNGYAGCIVQRRSLAYVEHTALVVPIDMLLVCVGVPCDETSTCAATGRCVSAAIDDPRACEPPRRCYPEGDPGAPDGGAPAADDAGADAAKDGGGGSSGDAGGDASDDAGSAGTTGVRCELETCASGQFCCVPNAGGTHECMPMGQTCPGSMFVCDGPEDCTSQVPRCCFINHAYCTDDCGMYDELCHSSADCGGRPCMPGPFGRYGVCSK